MDGSEGGISSPPGKSYMKALLASSTLPRISVDIRPSSTDNGEPAVFFTRSDIESSLEAFKYAVVAKTAFGRPPYPKIKEYLRERLGLVEDFTIAALDNQHLLLRMRNKEDFLKQLSGSRCIPWTSPSIVEKLDLIVGTQLAKRSLVDLEMDTNKAHTISFSIV